MFNMIDNLLLKPLNILVGFLYPAYASYKALEGGHNHDHQSIWLLYWVVFSSFTVIEYLFYYVVRIIPLFYVLKLAFIIWLQYPSQPGSAVIYKRFLLPLFKKHEADIDRSLKVVSSRAQAQLHQYGFFTSNSTATGVHQEGTVLSQRRREEAPSETA